MRNDRIKYIDCAKGILIVLVVFGHVLFTSHAADTSIGIFCIKLIWSFHMAAFFLISGILFNDEKWKNESLRVFVCEKLKKIMIPYFLFEIEGGVIHQIWNYGNVDSIFTIIKRIFTIDCYTGADWFLITYFLAEIGVYICIRQKKQWLNIFLTIITLVIPSVVFGEELDGILNIIVRCGIGFGLIMLGKMGKNILTKKWNVLFLTFSLIGVVVSSMLNEEVLLHVSFTGNLILFLVSSICGTYFIINIARYISSGVVEYIGKYSIIVLGTHQNVLWILAYYFGAQPTIECVALYFCISIVCSIIFILIWNKAHYFGRFH